jgi:hypothetical protein
MSPGEYKALVKATGAKAPRSKPELHLQIEMARWLRANLRPEVRWTASASGVHLGPRGAHDLKASGLEPGWPDLSFLCLDGVTRFIEVKAGSALSAPQKAFRASAAPFGIWARARSVDELIATVTAWGLVKPAVRQ